MIHKMAEDIAFYFIKRHSININDREIYEYGAEVLINNIIVLAILLIISLITNNMILYTFFIFLFMPLRSCVGGYHAPTQNSCIILTILFYISMIIFDWYFTMKYSYNLFLIIVISADLVIIENINLIKLYSGLSERIKKRNLVKSANIMLIAHIALGFCIYVGNMQCVRYICILLGFVALLIEIQNIIEGGINKNETC